EPFGMRAQRHQRDELALVDIDGEVAFGGDRDRLWLAVFVDGVDLSGERRAGLGQAGKHRAIVACLVRHAAGYFLPLVIVPDSGRTLGGATEVPAGECAPEVSSGVCCGWL